MQDPRQPGPEPSASAGEPAGKSFDKGHIARRLHKLAAARLETNEELVTWERTWVSRDGRYSGVFGARTRDFAVLTDRRLMLWSTGFFTRGPRRRVLTDRLDDLTVEDFGRTPLRMLRVRAFARRPLRFEFSRRASLFPRLLLEFTATPQPAAAGPGDPAADPAPEPAPPEHPGMPNPPKDAPWRP
jgi:hypothetical protein